jgi:hypothetical protein
VDGQSQIDFKGISFFIVFEFVIELWAHGKDSVAFASLRFRCRIEFDDFVVFAESKLVDDFKERSLKFKYRRIWGLKHNPKRGSDFALRVQDQTYCFIFGFRVFEIKGAHPVEQIDPIFPP